MLALTLTSLLACRAAPIIETKTVEVPVPVRVPLDPRLLVKPPKPPRPPNACRDAANRPTICNAAMADWVAAYDALVNVMYGKLDGISALQPKGAK